MVNTQSLLDSLSTLNSAHEKLSAVIIIITLNSRRLYMDSDWSSNVLPCLSFCLGLQILWLVLEGSRNSWILLVGCIVGLYCSLGRISATWLDLGLGLHYFDWLVCLHVLFWTCLFWSGLVFVLIWTCLEILTFVLKSWLLSRGLTWLAELTYACVTWRQRSTLT
jgi:hypothetical protein